MPLCQEGTPTAWTTTSFGPTPLPPRRFSVLARTARLPFARKQAVVSPRFILPTILDTVVIFTPEVFGGLPDSSPGGIPPVTNPVITLSLSLNGTRFRLGDRITVAFAAPEIPPVSPVAVVTGPDGVPVKSFPMPYAGPPGVFAVTFPVPAPGLLGTFGVSVAYETPYASYIGSADFTTINGGDAAGRVVSVFGVDGHMVAQVDSGRILQGSDPQVQAIVWN